MTCLQQSSYLVSEPVHWDVKVGADNCLLPVYCFVRDYVSASGASTVAIDNKIEQAMDLVKSHLMFAVREEVDVLKEKITELMDRINQLEYENSVLKSGASPETLAKLSSSSSAANNPSS